MKIKTYEFVYFSKDGGRAGLWRTRANKVKLATEKFLRAMHEMKFFDVEYTVKEVLV